MRDLDAYVAAALAAADVAGAVIRPFFRAGVGAELKSDASPVTIADRTAERALRAVLAERFPDHGILGEEFGLENPTAGLRWVLDPIDGTRAFITGRPTFGTLIALLDGDTPILGVIDQCISGERWLGVAGRETVFTGPAANPIASPIGGRRCARLADAELSCTSPDMFEPADLPAWGRLRAAVKRTSWGGDCYAHGLVAIGQIDIVAEATMKVWDWAALVPVVEGAGGRVTDWQGHKLDANGNGQVISVGDASLLAEAVALLNAVTSAAD